ncbi:leucine zipper domain-containing protein [Dankookia sp. GCM10030260]|uniref:leucine zipper domain-containing protein n=1 Tax=Dankookia sp. GCM10030260 TaxID=3273390 RepID=UPI003614FECE
MATSLGVTPRTVCKWRDRHAAEGQAGLRDRSSRPHRGPRNVPAYKALPAPHQAAFHKFAEVPEQEGQTPRRRRRHPSF